jgi:hypothetical protein
MSTKPKKKMCWNCEGRVTFQDENCPYCGVYLSPLNEGATEDKEDLFAPPYRMGGIEEEEEQAVPLAPYTAPQEAVAVAIPKQAIEENHHESTGPFLSADIKAAVLPLIFLLGGSVCFLFGIALLLFSQHGTLTLQWSGDYWFVYFIAALPMLLFGWKYLQGPEE